MRGKLLLLALALSAWAITLTCVCAAFLLQDTDQIRNWLFGGVVAGLVALALSLLNLWLHRSGR